MKTDSGESSKTMNGWKEMSGAMRRNMKQAARRRADLPYTVSGELALDADIHKPTTA